jgi:putative SOS response-associated peptidase YedK
MLADVCGRYTLTAAPARVAEQFEVEVGAELRPRSNVAPGQDVAAVLVAPDGKRALAALRWGLVPRAAARPDPGARTINARVESAAERPAFREAYRKRRCLLPADGFYEWRRSTGGAHPYHVTLPGGALFAFAGLWERWEGATGSLSSCTILTGPARGALRELHDRMPLLLSPGDYAAWLDPARTEPARVHALLGSPLSEMLAFRAVDPRVNDPRFDEPECLAPAPQLSLL